MPIEPRTNDYVDGGKWLDAPGSALESGIYALAMAMATEPHVTGPPDWSTGTLEKRYLDALHDIQSQYLGFDDENYLLNDSDLTDIIVRWERRYKDTYDLYIDNEDDIKPAQVSGDSALDAKVILLRCHNRRWQACCYFGKNGSSVSAPPEGSSPNQRSAPQSSATSMGDQTSSGEAATTPEKHDNSTNDVNGTSSTIELTIGKLTNTLEGLVTAVEKIALAVDARQKSEGSLRTAIESLMLPLDKVAQKQARRSPHETTDKHDSKTSTEYDLRVNTPSTVRDTVTAESVSSLDDCGSDLASASHSDFMDYDGNFDNHGVNDLDGRIEERRESLIPWYTPNATVRVHSNDGL
ncbi:hypothetical protein M436DRAFT_61685 [Aureobasidium namibiae CBS 147.97]|uniref:Uncharacterized protein n=1 Tax=Aureobasidium namibiae CBS 147.97 TaxID=1043004 RepID=A0A074XL23_9PEZI